MNRGNHEDGDFQFTDQSHQTGINQDTSGLQQDRKEHGSTDSLIFEGDAAASQGTDATSAQGRNLFTADDVPSLDQASQMKREFEEALSFRGGFGKPIANNNEQPAQRRNLFMTEGVPNPEQASQLRGQPTQRRNLFMTHSEQASQIRKKDEPEFSFLRGFGRNRRGYARPGWFSQRRHNELEGNWSQTSQGRRENEPELVFLGKNTSSEQFSQRKGTNRDTSGLQQDRKEHGIRDPLIFENETASSQDTDTTSAQSAQGRNLFTAADFPNLEQTSQAKRKDGGFGKPARSNRDNTSSEQPVQRRNHFTALDELSFEQASQVRRESERGFRGFHGPPVFRGSRGFRGRGRGVGGFGGFRGFGRNIRGNTSYMPLYQRRHDEPDSNWKQTSQVRRESQRDFLGGFGNPGTSSGQFSQRRRHYNEDDSNWKQQRTTNLESTNKGTKCNSNEKNAWNQTNSRSRGTGHDSRFCLRLLENLLEKDSEELVLELSNLRKELVDYTSPQELTDDMIVLFVKLLGKVSDSPFVGSKHRILQAFLEVLAGRLVDYIVRLPLHDRRDKLSNVRFWQNSEDFWCDVVKISREVFEVIPTFGCKVLPKILQSLIAYFPVFEQNHGCHVSDEIKDKVEKLNEAVQVWVKKQEEKERARQQTTTRKIEEPPDDFRKISVYPSSRELMSTDKVFLRNNVVKGPYRDVDHYLDVQFRLLREDFVRPLRAGIASYRSESQNRTENVKIYHKIRFLNPETLNQHYCIRLQFNFAAKKKSFKYENSRRFMFGSLLCFTCDNFATLIFGKICRRDVEDLQNGHLLVSFDENVVVDYKIDYVMVECSVYFEPYFHVLTVLQSLKPENFPMERYIVQVNPRVEIPEYLLNGDDLEYVIDGRAVLLRDQRPTKTFYNMNDSQHEAFKAALTQEFVIIQGPPGTGKTFLGLKVAKTLLENKRFWYRKSPMLVICYTNHALDQFLEGILPFTDAIVRVGGQSKNENLQKFNLKNRSRFNVSPAVSDQRDKVELYLGSIQDITDTLYDISLYDGVKAFFYFRNVVPNFDSTWFHRADNSEVLDWLLGEPIPGQAMGIMQMVRQLDNADIGNTESGFDVSDDEDDIAGRNENYQNQVDDIFDKKIKAIWMVENSDTLITIESLYKQIVRFENGLITIRQVEEPTVEDLLQEKKYNSKLFELQKYYTYLTAKLAEGKEQGDTIQIPPDVDLNNPRRMSLNSRWALYFHWLNLYRKNLEEELVVLNKEFRENYKIYEEMRDIENTNFMKDVLVVGMTTTSAARLRNSLQALKSPIVIVEEAAEVLEAHIVTSLTNHCKHLILIGDHQQLKPSTTDYGIDKFYNLGISLFERMVINKIQCYTLNVQHRMRPEISSLICPTIYPSLEDHPSVVDRPLIRGIDKPLFFIDHTHKEERSEGTSKTNLHEVDFLIGLARYLILNGYEPENVTILTTYLGQMFELQKAKKSHKDTLANVRIAVLDNYQGEECDVILLSLVRSNDENKIGFLSIENRVCVALSRARDGFYIIGNMEQLCGASELWCKIRRTFAQQDAIGPALELRCQVHTETVTLVKTGEDFLNVSEGGCSQRCEAELACGHNCTSLCHVMDRDHQDYPCTSICGKKLCEEDDSHLCRKMCYQDCGPCTYPVKRSLRCGHVVDLPCHVDIDKYDCVVPVHTVLPCGHEADKPCCRDPNTFRCPHPCEVKVEPCGHSCQLSCHVRLDPDHLEYKCRKKCARYNMGCTVQDEQHLCLRDCYEDCDLCTITVRKNRTVCPHVYKVPCHSDVDDIVCLKPCKKLLSCGHKCNSKCNEPCGQCEVKVVKLHPVCGHPLNVKCSEGTDRKLCDKKCPLVLPCGHPCTTKCNQPCTTKCQALIGCDMSAPCGHTITEIPCHLSNTTDTALLLKYCNRPCQDQLQCNHRCSGTCGGCRQGRVHKRCEQKCGATLVCGHPCEFSCREACRPCDRKCQYRCEHSVCGKKCGEVCTPCAQECPRRCEHQRCRKLCGMICDVPPCNLRCKKKLRCGHHCVGFCGDPCPPKCLVCDKEELTEIFFGYEDEEGARFVLLRDCKHILESTGLEQSLQQNEDQITFKVCPKCTTPIKTTQRYSDYVKRAVEDVGKVKRKSNGTIEENEEKRLQLKKKVLQLRMSSPVRVSFPTKLTTVMVSIEKRLEVSRKGKRQPINKQELNAITSKLQIVEHVVNICCNNNNVSTFMSHDIYLPQLNFIVQIISREESSITNQEIDDLQFELSRLSRIVEFAKIKNSHNFESHFSTNNTVKLLTNDIQGLLFGFDKFYEDVENKVKGFLKELSYLVPSNVDISESERRAIVQAVGLSKGHWFKCPNGHPYAIGECGGAMQESKCYECGAAIGGTHHSLLASNRVATEMDGATHGAWSDAANMANYVIDEPL